MKNEDNIHASMHAKMITATVCADRLSKELRYATVIVNDRRPISGRAIQTMRNDAEDILQSIHEMSAYHNVLHTD